MGEGEHTLVPNSVGIIMDGNRRWAKKRGLPTSLGHKAGYEQFIKIVQTCFDLGVKSVTVYGFSTENWKRTEDEVSDLMKLLSRALFIETDKFKERDYKVNFIGNRDDFSKEIVEGFEKVEDFSKDKIGGTLNVALSYGGRSEIVRAAKLAAETGEITEESISENLFTKDQPDPDLIIRTGGDSRLSNFMLWQVAYSELYFAETLWPDFDENELKKAFSYYNNVKRNFGR